MGEERLSPHGQSQVDREVVTILRAALEQENITQKELSARTGLSQPLISRRLSTYGSSIPVREFLLLCAGLNLDPVATLATAEARAESNKARSSQPDRTGHMADSEIEQVHAVGRQLAQALWEGADDNSFVIFAINQMVARDNHEFWTSGKQRLVLMSALDDLATAISLRYSERDQFPLKPILEPEDIIQ